MMRTMTAAALLLWGSLTSPSLAATLTMRCSFTGLIPQEVLYVINADTKEVSVIGAFGTHKAILISADEGAGFYYVVEPNKGASAATILYLQGDDTPVGIRATLGLLSQGQYGGIPDELKHPRD